MSFPNFLDLRFLPVKDAEAVILPIPYEATTTYGSGTREAPEAILPRPGRWSCGTRRTAGTQRRGAPGHRFPPDRRGFGAQAMLDKIRKTCRPGWPRGRWSWPWGRTHHHHAPGAVRADQVPDLQIVALDAHADMRDSYEGSKLSHACALKRVYDLGRPLTTLGVRSYSQEESQLTWVAPRYKMFKARELHMPEVGPGRRTPAGPLRPVYVSIDADVFDPGIMPGVGTPEPGGLSYYQVLTLLKTVAQRGPIVGLDLVELSPIPAKRVSEFTAAGAVQGAGVYVSGTPSRLRAA